MDLLSNDTFEHILRYLQLRHLIKLSLSCKWLNEIARANEIDDDVIAINRIPICALRNPLYSRLSTIPHWLFYEYLNLRLHSVALKQSICSPVTNVPSEKLELYPQNYLVDCTVSPSSILKNAFVPVSYHEIENLTLNTSTGIFTCTKLQRLKLENYNYVDRKLFLKIASELPCFSRLTTLIVEEIVVPNCDF